MGGIGRPHRHVHIAAGLSDVTSFTGRRSGRHVWHVDGGAAGTASITVQHVPDHGPCTAVQTVVPTNTADEGTAIVEAAAAPAPDVVTMVSTASATADDATHVHT